jgi:hypothetical protein
VRAAPILAEGRKLIDGGKDRASPFELGLDLGLAREHRRPRRAHAATAVVDGRFGCCCFCCSALNWRSAWRLLGLFVIAVVLVDRAVA